MISETGFLVVDKDGDPIGSTSLRVYLERERAEVIARNSDRDTPKLKPHRVIGVRIELSVQP